MHVYSFRKGKMTSPFHGTVGSGEECGLREGRGLGLAPVTSRICG